ncbi:efflux RND transporter permease subunit [candidate division TA06 bacterium]|nr:efflux RND transporter permease subunit [candidate division TA06 bacterium]
MWSKIIAFSLKNRLLVLFGAVMMIAFGFRVITEMPVDVYPDIEDPRVTILTEAHGWSPEEVEALVTFPMESAFNGTPFVKRVRSSSGIGLSVIFVEFEWGTDIFVARQMVNERLQLVAPTLPEGVDAPIVAPITSRLGEIVEYAVVDESGRLSSMEMRELNDWVVRYRLQSVGGIANVINQGGLFKQYQVLVHPEKLIQYDLSLEDIDEALTESNLNSAGGIFLQGAKEALIRGLGRIQTLEDLENVVITTREHGTPILIKDIADVKIGSQPKRRRGAGTLNGEEAALGKVSKQPGVNTLTLTQEVMGALDELRSSLPPGVSIRTEYLQSNLIRRAIETVKDALVEGSVLVIIILMIFLFNLRTSLITLTAIPLSLILGVIVLNWFGKTINIFTIAGFAIAVGMVVDDGIIDVENIFRRLREYFHAPTSERPTQVVLRASNEIRSSIVYATLIIILVFIPLFTLSGVEGRMFAPLALAVTVAMGASLLVALTVIPVLSDILLTRGKRLQERDSPVVRWIKRGYRPLLRFFLNKKREVVVFAVLMIATALLLIPRMGREFLPIMDEGTFVINALLPPGTSLEETQKIGSKIEKVLLEFPFVLSTSNRTGRAKGDEHAEGVNYNEILVNILSPEEREESMEELKAQIRERLGHFPGVVIAIGQPIQHRLDHMLSGVNAQVALKLFGSDLDILRAKAKEIEAVVAQVEGVEDLAVEQQVEIPQLQFKIDREAAARYGLSVGKLAHFIESAFNGEVVSQIIQGQRQYDLFLRLDEKSFGDLEKIKNLRVKTPTGPRVPLGRLANIHMAKGPNTINRENVSRRIVIQCNVSGRDLGGFVEEIQRRISEQVTLPEGYFITYGGQFESQQRAMRQLMTQAVFIIIAMFLLLHISLGSTRTAFVVMLNLPLALVGGVFSVFLSGGTLSVSSLVGFILLFGIAVRNGIILITHTNDLRETEGMGLREAVLLGAEHRVSPVLMTALTTGLGMLPLALASGSGAEIQKPLAIVIVGGLMSSMFLTLLVLPVFYYMIERRGEEKKKEVKGK